jgi:hypothetical protein
MRWLLWRELTLMTRIRALWIVMAIQLTLLSGVLVVWGDGVPVLSGSVYAQFVTIHFTMLLAIVPWLAARCSTGEAADMADVAAVAAVPLRAVVMARWLALATVLVLAVVSSLPMHVVAWRVAGLDASAAVSPLMVTVALCVFVPAFVTTVIVLGAKRFSAWAATAALTPAGVTIAASAAMPLLVALAVLLVTAAIVQAERRLRHPRPTMT